MNQILSFQSAESSKKQTTNAIRFFCITILIFGLVFVGEGIWGYLNRKNREVHIETPDMHIERMDDYISVSVTSNSGVSHIKYYWKIMNEGKSSKETVEKTNGDKEASIKIPALNGTNELYLEVLDADGNIIKYDPIMISYEIENNNNNSGENNNGGGQNTNWEELIKNDQIKPSIRLEAMNGKVKIIATDNLKMSYVAFRWNDGAESTITGLSEDEKTIEQSIDVGEGNNKLTVTAYDRAGNQETVEKTIQGVKGPTLNVRKENGQIIADIDDDEKITKIVYNFNGNETTIDNINETHYELTLDLVEGNNYVIIEAYRGDVKSTYKGKTTN